MSQQLFHPYDEGRIPLSEQFAGWSRQVLPACDPEATDALTRCRILLLDSLEQHAFGFLGSLYEHLDDEPARRLVAEVRRAEAQQQMALVSLIPAGQSILQTTIFYEQSSVELAAALVGLTPDPYVQQLLAYTLLDDFDHLYRFAQVLEALEGLDAAHLTQGYTEVAPGRSTPEQHLHPIDTRRRHGDKYTADIRTKLSLPTLIAVAEQKYRYYKAHGPEIADPLARGLYAEIAEVEEQHVTELGSFADPTRTWLKRACLYQVVEAYNYWSAWRSEPEPRTAGRWERLYRMELEHIRLFAAELQRLEGEDVRAMIPEEVPDAITLESHRGAIRDLLFATGALRPIHETYVPFYALPPYWASFGYMATVNDGGVPSQRLGKPMPVGEERVVVVES